MELSDGDDESDEKEADNIHSSCEKQDTSITAQYSSRQISSQIVSDSVSYNNPHSYQPYYQNYQQLQEAHATAGNDPFGL